MVIAIWGTLILYGTYHAIEISKSVCMTLLYANTRSLMIIGSLTYGVAKTDGFIIKVHLLGLIAYALYLLGIRTYCAVSNWSDYLLFRKAMNDHNYSMLILISIAVVIITITTFSLIWKRERVSVEDLVQIIEKNTFSQTDKWMVRTAVAVLVAFMGYNMSFQNSISSRVAVVEQNQINDTTIVKLERRLWNTLGSFLTIRSYMEIEKQRASDITRFIINVKKNAYIKDEELMHGRISVESDMASRIKLGTARGGIK